MNYLVDLLKDPTAIAAIALAIAVICLLPLMRRGVRGGGKQQQKQQKAVRTSTIQRLRDSNAFQMLEMTEEDVNTILDIVVEDNLKLQGKYKRAAQHIQNTAYQRGHATLSEDQITAVLVAYRQSSTA